MLKNVSPVELYKGFSGGRKIDEGVAAGVLAERYVVGAILANNSLYELSQPMTDRDFEDIVCRRIYGAISRVMRGEVTGLSRIDAVTCTSFEEVAMFITPTRLVALVTQASGVTEEDFLGHVDLIRHRSGRRQLLEQVGELHALISKHDVTDTQIARAIRSIGESSACSEVKSLPIGEFGQMAIDQITESAEAGRDVPGISTGFDELDKLTGGLVGGQLIVIAGRPAMGKTTLALNIAEHVAGPAEDKYVLVVSLEMSGVELAKRMISGFSGVESGKLKSGALNKDEWARVSKAGTYLSELKIDLSDSGGLDYDRLIQSAKTSARKGRLDMIVIDYLQLMSLGSNSGRSNRQEQISEISRGLKNLARELDIPIIALSQLSRKLEERQDKRPILSDLRESGAIEQDSDVVMFVYRDEVYNPATLDAGTAEIIVAKQRSGAIGTVRLGFNGGITAFQNLSLDGKPKRNVNLQSFQPSKIAAPMPEPADVERKIASGSFLYDDEAVMNVIFSGKKA